MIKNIDDFVYSLSEYLKNEEYEGKKLIDYISFIECDKFDTISRKEFEFITTDIFFEISSLLHCQSIKFNDDFSICELGENLFSINNVGKKFYTPASYYKSRTTGRVSLKWNDTTIQIPFANSSNNNIVEVSKNLYIAPNHTFISN